MRASNYAAALAVCLSPVIAQAQYHVESTADGWSYHHYNYGAVGSSMHVNPGSTASGTMDATGLATSAYSETSGSSSSPAHVFSTSDALYGFGDLPTVSVGTTDYDTGVNGIYTGADGGTSHGAIFDTLTFNVLGGNSGTITNIGITFTQKGHMKQSGTFVEGHGETTVDMFFGGIPQHSTGAVFRTDIKLGNDTGYVAGINYADSYPYGTPYTTTSLTPELIVIHETLTLTGSSVTIPFSMQMNSWDYDGMDMASTASLAFDMPTNVSIGSSSGAFAQAVPEPGSMIVLGLGVCGLVRRRRMAK